jgi:hypothetical protein
MVNIKLKGFHILVLGFPWSKFLPPSLSLKGKLKFDHFLNLVDLTQNKFIITLCISTCQKTAYEGLPAYEGEDDPHQNHH